MADGSAHGDAAADRVAHNVGLREPKMLDQRGDVVGHRFVTQWAVDIGGAPVSLQIDGNHFPVLRKRRHDVAEYFGSGQPAVQQDQRLSRTVDFVIQIEAVYGSVPGFEGSRRACLSECEADAARMIPAAKVAMKLLIGSMVNVSSYLHVEQRAAKSTG